MIKKLNVRNGIVACVLGFTLMTEAGCGLLTSEEEIDFGDEYSVTTARYYDIEKNGHEYFVDKGVLGDAIPEYNNTYYVGLRVDENGNTVVVGNDQVMESDDVIACMKTHASGDDYDFGVYISDVDSIDLVDGYHIIDNGTLAYDISKDDVEEIGNDMEFSFEANLNGGADFVRVR